MHFIYFKKLDVLLIFLLCYLEIKIFYYNSPSRVGPDNLKIRAIESDQRSQSRVSKWLRKSPKNFKNAVHERSRSQALEIYFCSPQILKFLFKWTKIVLETLLLCFWDNFEA